MESAWLYHNLGTIAQIAGLCALVLIGLLTLRRKRKGKKLQKNHNTKKSAPGRD